MVQTKRIRIKATINALTWELSFSAAAAASSAVDIVTNANPLFLPSFPLMTFTKQTQQKAEYRN
jgi:uncharacterized membrane protein